MFTNFPFFPQQASAQAGQVDAIYFFMVAVTAFFSILIAALGPRMLGLAGELADGTVTNHLVNWLSPMKERLTVITGERGAFGFSGGRGGGVGRSGADAGGLEYAASRGRRGELPCRADRP